MNNSITKALLFVITLSTSIMAPSLIAEDKDFESWKESHFENYPFECVPTGSTPEYTRCASEDLLKGDWELKKELNNDELWKQWRKVRGRVCYHYQNKFFGQGTVKPLMTISCEQRLNSEIKRYFITGEDKQCG